MDRDNKEPANELKELKRQIAELKSSETELKKELEYLRNRVDQARAQQELSQGRLSMLMNYMSSGMAVYEAIGDGEDFIFKDFNKAGERIDNVKREDLIGKRLTGVFPGVKEFGLFAVFQRVWRTGKPEHHPISLYEDKKLVGWRENQVFKLPTGEIAALYDDMTKQKVIEMELREINKNLEETVYITSHDLQAPLISMEGYASELLDKYGHELDENGRYCLTRLKTNAVRVHALVLSLLDMSRLNTQKYPHETFDTVKVVNEIVKDLSLAVERAGAEIRVMQMPPMHGDKKRLSGVFRKLITNALMYGGKTVTVGYAHKKNAWFVRDDGIGLPPDQLEKIFNPGERLKKVESEGVGMGLTFCRKVISLHNGRIWVESAGDHKGAAFYFKIKTRVHDTIDLIDLPEKGGIL